MDEATENNLIKILKKIFIIGIIILLSLVSYIGYNEYSNMKNQINHYKSVIDDKNKLISDYQKEVSNYQEKIDNYNIQIRFMDEHVAICPLDGSGLYHKYGCEHLDLSSFMIYNSEQAPNEGFRPCYYCSELDNTSNLETEIVYITDTGSKYHKSNCSYLNSKKSITKEKAIEQGYTACSRCNP